MPCRRAFPKTFCAGMQKRITRGLEELTVESIRTSLVFHAILLETKTIKCNVSQTGSKQMGNGTGGAWPLTSLSSLREQSATFIQGLGPRIDGQMVLSTTGGVHSHVNPATGLVQAELALGGVAEIDRAVAAAKRMRGPWRKIPTRQLRSGCREPPSSGSGPATTGSST